jgi:hypothetical protein
MRDNYKPHRSWAIGAKHTDEALAKMRTPRSEETKKNMRHPKNKTICPHCNKEGAVNQLKRYHFDNCKFLNLIEIDPTQK